MKLDKHEKRFVILNEACAWTVHLVICFFIYRYIESYVWYLVCCVISATVVFRFARYLRNYQLLIWALEEAEYKKKQMIKNISEKIDINKEGD